MRHWRKIYHIIENATARKRHCMKRAQQRETSHGDTEKEAVLGKQ